MICKKCYTNNEDGAKFCVGCGERMEEEKKETTTSNVNTQFNNTQSVSNNDVVNNTQGFSNSQNNNNGQNVQNYNNTQYNSNTQNQYNDGSIPAYNPVSAIIAIVVSSLSCCGMIGAIFGILSLVFGILSLVEGSKVKEFVQQGNIEMAREKLKQAKKWNMIAWIIAGIGVAVCILYFIFMVVIGIMSEM